MNLCATYASQGLSDLFLVSFLYKMQVDFDLVEAGWDQ